MRCSSWVRWFGCIRYGSAPNSWRGGPDAKAADTLATQPKRPRKIKRGKDPCERRPRTATLAIRSQVETHKEALG